MNSRVVFWGLFLISIGIISLLYKFDLFVFNNIDYVYFISLTLILFGIKILLKKDNIKIIITILISLTLSFGIMKFFGEIVNGCEKTKIVKIQTNKYF
jgi:hypothetical protein